MKDKMISRFNKLKGKSKRSWRDKSNSISHSALNSLDIKSALNLPQFLRMYSTRSHSFMLRSRKKENNKTI